jgi:NitT/TauT family transport system permease protein
MRKRDIALAIVAVFVGWQMLAMVLHRPVFPPPMDVLRAFVQAVPDGLGRHFLVSGWRVAISIIVAAAAAVPIGLALGLSPAADRLAAPLITFCIKSPRSFSAGICCCRSSISKVFMMLYPVLSNPGRSRIDSPSGPIDASVRSIGADRRALFRFVYLPACLPGVLTAVQVSIGIAIAVLFSPIIRPTWAGLLYHWTHGSWPTPRCMRCFGHELAGLLLYLAVDRLQVQLSPWLEGVK